MNILAFVLFFIGLAYFYMLDRTVSEMRKHLFPYVMLVISAVISWLGGRADAGYLLLILLPIYFIIHVSMVWPRR